MVVRFNNNILHGCTTTNERKTMERLTKEDIKFIIEEVFADFFEHALDKNVSGNYCDEVMKLDTAERHLIEMYERI